jgi:hypothetical protein
MATNDHLERHAFEAERDRQTKAAQTELRDVLYTAHRIELDLKDGSKSLATNGRRLASSAALLLERLAALDALESVSFMAEED